MDKSILWSNIFLNLYSGLNSGWGIFNNHLRVQPWSGGYADVGEIFWSIYSWYLVHLFILLFESFFIKINSKKSILFVATCFALASATIFVKWPADIGMIVLARSLGGFSVGLKHISFLLRDSCGTLHINSIRNLSLIIGALFYSFSMSKIYKTRNYEIDPSKMMGYVGMFFASSSLILIKIPWVLSKMGLIKSCNKDRQSGETKTFVIKEKKKLHKTIVAIFLKIFVVASFNMPVNVHFLDMGKLQFYDGFIDMSSFIFLCFRLAAGIIPLFLKNFRQCIKLFRFSSFVSGSILLISSFCSFNNPKHSAFISILFQIFGSLMACSAEEILQTFYYGSHLLNLLSNVAEVSLQMILIIWYFYVDISITYLLTGFGVVTVFGIAHQCFSHKLISDETI